MVQRVNFLEKGPYSFTYRNLLMIAGALCLVCIFIHGLFMARNWMVRNQVIESKRIVQELTIQKEKALALMQSAGGRASGTVTQALVSLFSKVPAWSTALRELADNMPKQVWLEQLRSESGGEGTGLKKVEMSGRGVSVSSIAQFVKQLETSSWFQNVALVSSQKEEGGQYFKFVVNAEVIFHGF